MPKAVVRTNLSTVPDGFEQRLCQKMSEAFKYSLEVIYATVSTGERMYHNNSEAPLVFVDISTCNRLNEKSNPGYTRILGNFIKDELNVPLSRILIQYIDAQMYDWGVQRLPPEYTDPIARFNPYE